MRCAVSSGAGQVLAKGRLLIQKDNNGELRLYFLSDRGKLIQGGVIADDGDLTEAGKDLFRGLVETWGVSDVTLTANAKM